MSPPDHEIDHLQKADLGGARLGAPDKALGVLSPVIVPRGFFVFTEMGLWSNNLTERFPVGTEVTVHIPERKMDQFLQP